MNYDSVIKKIREFQKFGVKPGLNRVLKILNLIDNPQDKIKMIHVAGTNGKGSVCNMLSSVLSECGYKTGLYTSPSVVEFRERIKICGKMISKTALIKSAEQVFNAIDKISDSNEHPTEFEVVTAIAFNYFFVENCDIVVLETGLGGLYDATNVIKNPVVSIITSISYDHTNILGNTLEEITAQKCGIIKSGCDVVVYPEQEDIVMDVIKKHANENSSKIIISDKNNLSDIHFNLYNGTTFKFNNQNYTLSLLGAHQINNVCTALTAIKRLRNYFDIPYEKIYKALKGVYVPARFEILSYDPLIILDGAHNPSGTLSLSDNIKLYLKDKYIIAIIGMLSDKDYSASVSNILPLVSEIITVTPPSDRALKAHELQKFTKTMCPKSYCSDSLPSAINQAVSNKNSDKAIVIFGSLYLAGEVKKIFNQLI